MSDVKTNDPPSTVSLVQGIVGDIGALIQHEVRYARAEIINDLGKMKTAAAFLLTGAAAGFVGFVLLALMAAHGLHYATGPAPVDVTPGLPLWGCYGIVGAVFLAAGGALTWVGADRLSKVNPLPEKTIQNVQKDVSWIAQQTTTSK